MAGKIPSDQVTACRHSTHGRRLHELVGGRRSNRECENSTRQYSIQNENDHTILFREPEQLPSGWNWGQERGSHRILHEIRGRRSRLSSNKSSVQDAGSETGSSLGSTIPIGVEA